MFFDKDKKQMKEIENQIASKQQLYQRVFNSPDGKAVMEDLEKRCFIKHTTIGENSHKTYFNEGRRSIFVYINDLLSRDLKEILEALTKE